MILGNQVNSFNSIVEVGGTFTFTPGVSVTPGVSSVNGAWTAWATPTDDVYGIYLGINGGAVATTAKNATFDIGIDPSGGTSYTVLMQNVLCGSITVAGWIFGKSFYFPLYIKAGTSIAIRAATSHTAASAIRFYGQLACKPSNPAAIWAGSYCETIGYTSGCLGTAWTQGTTTAKSAWSALGTTTRPLKYWQLSCGWNNTVYTPMGSWVDIGYGDATNPTILFTDFWTGTASVAEEMMPSCPPLNAFADVPAGTTMYIRSSIWGTAVTGNNAVLIGIGG